MISEDQLPENQKKIVDSAPDQCIELTAVEQALMELAQAQLQQAQAQAQARIQTCQRELNDAVTLILDAYGIEAEEKKVKIVSRGGATIFEVRPKPNDGLHRIA